jgi:exoribonuclease-2
MKDGLVRADHLPLVFRAAGADSLPRGAHVRVRITGTDLLTLDLHASVVARLDDMAAEGAPADADADEGVDSAGPLTLAIDVASDDADTDAAAATVDAPAA